MLSFIKFMYVPNDLSPKLLAAFGIITSDENFIEQRKSDRPNIMGHDKSEHINSENSWETLRFSESLEHR